MKTAGLPLRLGRWGLLTTGLSITLAGLVILYLGSTEVFVAEDLGFMGVTRQMLDDVNPRLVPLIAQEGYVNPLHLAPALAGAALFGISMGCEIIGSPTRKSP